MTKKEFYKDFKKWLRKRHLKHCKFCSEESVKITDYDVIALGRVKEYAQEE